MVKKGDPKLPPTGWRKYIWRAPIYLYRMGLGPILGKRFLLLTHRGRKSGLPRQAVIEIVRYDPERDMYYVASGFGTSSNWYRNLQAHPEATIQIGNRTYSVLAHFLSPEESGEEMLRYARKHRRAALELARLIGLKIEDPEDEEEWRTMGHEFVPFVALQVVSEESTSSEDASNP